MIILASYHKVAKHLPVTDILVIVFINLSAIKCFDTVGPTALAIQDSYRRLRCKALASLQHQRFTSEFVARNPGVCVRIHSHSLAASLQVFL